MAPAVAVWVAVLLVAAACAEAADNNAGAQWRGDNKVVLSPLDRIVFPTDESPFARAPFEPIQDIRKRYQRAVEAIFAMTIRLKLFLHVNDKDNFLVSPVSVAAALGELLLGSRGHSREQLEWLLTTEDDGGGGNLTTAGDGAMLELHRQLGGLVSLLETGGSNNMTDGYLLHVASAFFVQPDLKMKPDYVHAVTQLYGLKFVQLDFSGNPTKAQAVVNQWCSEQTNGLITQAVPGGLPATTASLLLNTVYFRGDWEMPFDPQLTVPGVFSTTPDRGVRVQFMRGQLETLYAESESMGCRMVALPYKGSHAAMFVLMPLKGRAEHDLQKFVASLSFRNVRDLIASAENRSVTVALPKMVLKETLSIRDAVTKVKEKLKEEKPAGVSPPQVLNQRFESDGTPYMFQWGYNYKHQYYFFIPSRIDVSYWRNSSGDNDVRPPPPPSSTTTPPSSTTTPPSSTTTADPDDKKLDLDMSGASADLRFRVDDVVHQTVVDISEKGTEAAGASSSTVDYIGDVKIFKVDSPFMFFVRHEVTLASLFWGLVVDPTGGHGEYVPIPPKPVF